MGTSDIPDEVEGSSTPKRSRFDLQRRDVEEEDRSVRRSSRITRYKLDARNQSALYDRLITKWVKFYKEPVAKLASLDFFMKEGKSLFVSTAEAVLQKMDDMQKMRRRLRDRGAKEEVIYCEIMGCLLVWNHGL